MEIFDTKIVNVHPLHGLKSCIDIELQECETCHPNFKLLSGFRGWVSVEYEGGLLKMYSKDDKYLDDDAGVLATKKLIERVANT